MKRTLLRAITALATTLGAVGCATAPSPEELFEAGDLGGALTEYEAEPSARALFMRAMIHLDREWFDPQRAVDLLTQLSAEYPESAYNRVGVLWLTNWRERDRLAAELEKKLQEISTLHEEGDALRNRIDSKDSAISSRAHTIRTLNEQIETLRAEVELLTTQLEERERERDELLQIGLDSEPLDTSLDPED